MTYQYTSKIRWTPEDEYHGTISTEKGFTSTFDKPSEFGGKDGTLNPEDAFVASLAMCYSITVKEICDKMRLEVDDFSLTAKGIIEDGEEGKVFTKVYIYPSIKIDCPDKKTLRALELAKDNCLISRSLKTDIIIEPKIL